MDDTITIDAARPNYGVLITMGMIPVAAGRWRRGIGKKYDVGYGYRPDGFDACDDSYEAYPER